MKYHGHLLYYQATVLAIVIYCLRLFNVYCYHGDGSDGQHVCTKAMRTIIRLLQ